MKKFKIKSGDQVLVTAGANKGAKGKVLRILSAQNRVLVEGVNKMKKHTKPTAENPKGGVVQSEAPIAISNVALIDPKSNKPTRVGYRFDEKGKKVRYAKKSGQII